jgi:hypothetical protein
VEIRNAIDLIGSASVVVPAGVSGGVYFHIISFVSV